ncbi:metalloreductase STEAP4 [Exaiptasia diaphana]|uniref:Pyrroline-5-carboxylate reductase catalytic N-terminal domain-containing protein n=1 Tax=Exaiptasia diaphana TaxID=2652724 RepID=A0A913YMM6_EXADI|nr:metalloreductase STEAP4 [Exaiptasia diaphana]
MSMNEEPIVIVGTGDFGRALATRLHRFGFKVVLGSRNPSTVETKVIPLLVDVLENKEALQRGNIIIFAVHRQSYEALANEYRDMLKQKIVVDVNNPQTSKKGDQSSGEYLASLLPESKVVKAFNASVARSVGKFRVQPLLNFNYQVLSKGFVG